MQIKSEKDSLWLSSQPPAFSFPLSLILCQSQIQIKTNIGFTGIELEVKTRGINFGQKILFNLNKERLIIDKT